MSAPERTDDPGEHGYGAAEKDSENLIGDEEVSGGADQIPRSRRIRRVATAATSSMLTVNPESETASVAMCCGPMLLRPGRSRLATAGRLN